MIENLWSRISQNSSEVLFQLYQAQPLPSGKRAGHKSIYAEMNAFYHPGSVGEVLGLFCVSKRKLILVPAALVVHIPPHVGTPVFLSLARDHIHCSG